MYEPCNEITPLVEVYQRWLNDQTRLAVRYGISTRKTHTWHPLTTTGITLADGRQLTMVVPSCLLSVSPAMNNAGIHVDVSVLVDINSLRESLTLLCWYELVDGLQNSDWQYLPGLSELEVKTWMETRLLQYPLLYSVVDEYVFFACFGLWSETPQC